MATEGEAVNEYQHLINQLEEWGMPCGRIESVMRRVDKIVEWQLREAAVTIDRAWNEGLIVTAEEASDLIDPDTEFPNE